MVPIFSPIQVILPRTDRGVLIQLIVSVVVSVALVAYLRRRERDDAAWLAAGAVCMWIAFIGFRSLH